MTQKAAFTRRSLMNGAAAACGALLLGSCAGVVIRVGRAREDALVRVARTVADRTDRELVEFPGAHLGYVTHPKAFAAKLTDVLAGK